VTVLLVFEWRQRRPTPTPSAAPRNEMALDRAGKTDPQRRTWDASEPAASPSANQVASLQRQIEAVFQKLLAGNGSARDVAALRAVLEKADAREAVAAALDFLRSGRDVPTGESFVVGADGRLSEAPTLRVMLLDLLGLLSRELKSEDGANYARIVLDSKNSPDEWSIALRNVAWHDPAAKPYLSAKVRELMSYSPWRQAPTAGMLEAFDVAVFVQDANLVPVLAENLVSEQAALQRASAIALDRLAERAPLSVMNYLNANPKLMAERPFIRADYFAKADLSQPTQREAVEFYLGRSDVSHEEKAKLLNALTTPASFVAEGLLTGSVPEPDDVARETAVLDATRAWLVQNRFPQLRSEIIEVQLRLRSE
ncbi:MAG TPA: hypothetical protein VFV83_00685, partial [Chthoniobacteraceae bacterium]|nr:hypothetical protein [Chthoniobacteraceae bacterium]